jgi:hypothetical protein
VRQTTPRDIAEFRGTPDSPSTPRFAGADNLKALVETRTRHQHLVAEAMLLTFAALADEDNDRCNAPARRRRTDVEAEQYQDC